MKAGLALVLLLPVFSTLSRAQNNIKISGTVYSKEYQCSSISGTAPDTSVGPLAGTYVQLVRYLKKQRRKDRRREPRWLPINTQSGIDGRFSLSFPESQKETYRYLVIKAVGYEPIVVPVTDSLFTRALQYFLIPTHATSDEGMIISKPAIYLYPTQKTDISVKHSFKGKLGTTYPAYGDGWEVIAGTDGALYNKKDNRLYEYLFWEGTYRFPDDHYNFQTGFVVKKEESQAFLLEKLALIGLNNKEINDFIVYWLPQLEQNEQNFIHFRINDDIDHSSVLMVTPQPESMIRLFMEFKPVPDGFRIAPQQLKPYPRKGFTLVEWGGAKLDALLSLQ